MNRRSFMKTIFTSAIAGFVVITSQVVGASASSTPSRGYLKSQSFGRSFQGTVDGRLLESQDNGKTWRQVLNFGDQISVLGMFEQQGSLYLEMGLRQYSFYLKSQDGRTWLTTDSIPQA